MAIVHLGIREISGLAVHEENAQAMQVLKQTLESLLGSIAMQVEGEGRYLLVNASQWRDQQISLSL